MWIFTVPIIAKCHEEILESEFHIRSKAETYTVKSYNIGAGAILHGLKEKESAIAKLSI